MRNEMEVTQFKENLNKMSLIDLLYLFRQINRADIEGEILICEEIENRINKGDTDESRNIR